MNQEFEYIAALQDFSKSLKYFTDSIKNQVINENKTFKDSISSTKDQAKMMMEMAEELKVISATTASTKTNTEEILDIVKGIKQEKKSGILDKLSGAKDKAKSMAEGIKSVALMAGAILAVGAAFKIIGDVDFKSVLALSVALPLMAMAFNHVGESTTSIGDSLIIAGSIVIMSMGIAIAGVILSDIPELSFMQLVSAVGVAAAVGVAGYLLGMAAEKIGTKGIAAIYLIAPALPLIAWGIAKAAEELSDIKPVTTSTIISAAGVGIAMGLALIPLAYAGKIIGNDINSLFKLAVIMPVIAGAIYLSALALENTPEVDVFKTISSTLGITVSIVIFGAGIWALDKLGINVGTALKGSVSMAILAGGIMAVSHIIALGNYTNQPSLEWGLSVGLVLLGGGLIATALTYMGGLGVIIPGTIAMLAVAAGVMAASHILAFGDYGTYPSLEWAQGVGLSMGAFGLAAVALGFVMMTGVGAVALGFGILGMAGIAAGLVAVSAIIGTGNYTGGPSVEWATGVGMALKGFTDAVSAVSPSGWDLISGNTMQDKINALVQIGAALPMIAAVISKGNYSGGPTADWGIGVGAAIAGFANATASMEDIDLDELPTLLLSLMPIANLMKYFGATLSSAKFDNYPSVDWVDGIKTFIEEFTELDMVDNAENSAKQILSLTKSYLLLAGSINVLGKALSTITAAPDLTGIYGGLVTLSLIDGDKLSATLDVLNGKKDEFQNVLSMIQAQSSVKIDESTFAFNKDKNTTPQQQPKSSTSLGPASVSSGPVVKALPKPNAVPAQPDKQEKLLNQLVTLMGQMNNVLGEIADNTSQKIHESNIISN